MAIPPFYEFLRPVLEEISDKKSIDSVRRALMPLIAQRMKLSEEDIAERLGSGQSRLANRCAWAVTYLSKAGLICLPQRGRAEITPTGKSFLSTHDGPIRISDLDQFSSFRDFKNAAKQKSDSEEETVSVADSGNGTDPEERIDLATNEIRTAVGQELLTILSEVDPTFFEHIILDVMLAMGYGGKVGRMEHTGGSGDFGIDGLDKIYVQAKRWKSPVRRPDVQGFYGALAGKRATKGVMITTSLFTDEALEFAVSVSNSLILVDGKQLTQLMIDFGVGVQRKKTIVLPSIDQDYFE
jgi:restriction system protein